MSDGKIIFIQAFQSKWRFGVRGSSSPTDRMQRNWGKLILFFGPWGRQDHHNDSASVSLRWSVSALANSWLRKKISYLRQEGATLTLIGAIKVMLLSGDIYKSALVFFSATVIVQRLLKATLSVFSQLEIDCFVAKTWIKIDTMLLYMAWFAFTCKSF